MTEAATVKRIARNLSEDEVDQVRLYYEAHLIPGYNDWEIQWLIELALLRLRCVRLRQQLDQIDATLNVLGARLEKLDHRFAASHARSSTTLLNASLVVRNDAEFGK